MNKLMKNMYSPKKENVKKLKEYLQKQGSTEELRILMEINKKNE